MKIELGLVKAKGLLWIPRFPVPDIEILLDLTYIHTFVVIFPLLFFFHL